MAGTMRKRTVFFFEIVEAKNHQPRMEPQDWRGFLDRISAAPPDERSVQSGEDRLIGAVDAATSEDHLLLAKITGEVPHQLDHSNGTIEALRLAAGTDVVHVTTLCFMPYGNIIGTLHGGFSAPRVSAITKWLNGVGLPWGEVVLKPVIHARAREKLNRIEAVSELTVQLEGAPADSVGALNAQSELGHSLRSFGQRHPDTAITLSLRVPRRGGRLSLVRRNRAATQLRSDVLQFIPDLDEWMDESGVVRSVNGQVAIRDPHRQSLEYEPLDFLEHRITAQCDVPVAFTDGRSVDLQFAVNAVFGAARTHAQELQEACQHRPLA
ncbi:hypothetical protein [Streptomyces sp. NPDC051576]|uniref:hypothetical protein n=1 Tax=Streptomyces sp. NPDC051576 TaxID=3155803 RepID=UPI0034474403